MKEQRSVHMASATRKRESGVTDAENKDYRMKKWRRLILRNAERLVEECAPKERGQSTQGRYQEWQCTLTSFQEDQF